MSHGYQITRWCGNHINLFMYFGKFFLKNDHGKYRSSGRYVTRSLCNTVGSCHTGTCITFWRTHWNTSLQLTCDIKKLSTFLGQSTCIFTGNKHFWHQLIYIAPSKAFVCNQCIEFIDHACIIVFFVHINREHTGCIANTKNFLSGQFPVNISSQCCKVGNILHMLFAIQNTLVQMCDAPSHRNVILEQFCQFFGSLSCICVTPCAKRYEKLVIFVKRHISMHHGTKSHCPNLLDSNAIFCLHILQHLAVAILQTCPDVV